jgi:hypothetical protein
MGLREGKMEMAGNGFSSRPIFVDMYRIGVLFLSSKGRLGVDSTPEDNDVATIEPAANAMLLFQPPPQIIPSSSSTWMLSIIVMDVIAFVHA